MYIYISHTINNSVRLSLNIVVSNILHDLREGSFLKMQH